MNFSTSADSNRVRRGNNGINAIARLPTSSRNAPTVMPSLFAVCFCVMSISGTLHTRVTSGTERGVLVPIRE